VSASATRLDSRVGQADFAELGKSCRHQ